MMTNPLKTPPKTASRAIFLRGKRRFTPKKAKKRLKTPPAIAYRGIFFKKKYAVKEPDPETGLYYYGFRYLEPKTGRWISGDPALGEYLPVAPLGDEEKKRNSNLPGMGGVFNYVNLHVYHYAGNNPVKYVDPDGRKLKLISEPLGSGYSQKRINDNTSTILVNLSEMIGAEIHADANGIISMGRITNVGEKWDAVRAQFSELLDSPTVVGITTLGDGFSGGEWGFNPIDDSSSGERKRWGKRNGVSAYVVVNEDVFTTYLHKNPKYKGWWSILMGQFKYTKVRHSIGGAMAHEVIGHARDFALTGETSEDSAVAAENLYHDAEGELSRDTYYRH
jgi:RHS repeat-associated protein